MKFEYERAIAELCVKLELNPEGLRIFPTRLIARLEKVQIAGYTHNPDFTVLDYGSTKDFVILQHFDIELISTTVKGHDIRYGYCAELNSLVIDEKWLDKRAQEIKDERKD